MAKDNRKKSTTIALDISYSHDLMRLAEEVEKTGRTQILRRGNKQIAKITPVKKRSAKRVIAEADYKAFRSAAGGWKDIVDVEKFLKDTYKSRDISSRPPVRL